MSKAHRTIAVSLMTAALLIALTACGSSGNKGAALSAVPSPSSSASVPAESATPSPTMTSEPQISPDDTKPSEPAASSTTDDHSPEPAASQTPMVMPSPTPPKATPSKSTPPKSTPSASPSPSPSRSPDKKPVQITVEIKDYAFAPDEVEIPPGSKVTFINRDSVKHTATADDGSFDTGLIGQDESQTVTFDKEGTFTYYCQPHPSMKAKIKVKAE